MFECIISYIFMCFIDDMKCIHRSVILVAFVTRENHAQVDTYMLDRHGNGFREICINKSYHCYRVNALPGAQCCLSTLKTDPSFEQLLLGSQEAGLRSPASQLKVTVFQVSRMFKSYLFQLLITNPLYCLMIKCRSIYI